jgi:hypothetical protein
MSVTLYTNYFVENIKKSSERLSSDTLASYEEFHTTAHETDMAINGHRLRMKYVLRMDIATSALVALPIPTAMVTVTYSAYDQGNNQWYHPNAMKESEFGITITATTLDDQINQAIEGFRLVIDKVPMPEIDFDFWTQVTKAMKKFENIKAAAARDNSDLITIIK